MSPQWYEGLCREFTKSVNDIINSHKLGYEKFDSEAIGREVICLFEELFQKEF